MNRPGPGPIDDDKARYIAQQAVAGLISETDARSSLRWLALMSDTPRKFASRFCQGMQKHLEDDVSDRIGDLLARKILQADGHGLDLGLIADGTPLSAFARSLVSTARLSIMRDVSAMRRNSFTDTTFTTTEDETHFDAGWADAHITPAAAIEVDGMGDRVEAEDVEDFLRSRGKSLSRVHLGARYLARRHYVRMPVLRVPAAARTALDSTLVNRAAVRRAIADALAESDQPRHPEISSVLRMNFSRADLSVLAAAPSEVGVAIVRAAATPRPALARNVRSALTALVRDRADGQSWWNVAGRLVYAFGQAIADLPNENANRFATATPRSDAAAVRDWEAFQEVAIEASRHPRAPMGSTGGCVEIELETMLAQVEVTIAAALAEDHATAAAANASRAMQQAS